MTSEDVYAVATGSLPLADGLVGAGRDYVTSGAQHAVHVVVVTFQYTHALAFHSFSGPKSACVRGRGRDLEVGAWIQGESAW